MKKYDVAIIGAGTSGLTARREVLKVTDNYLVIDDGILGTTCARVGCMPSKVLIQVAHDFHRREVMDQEGILGGSQLKVDQEKVMRHVRSLRDRFVRGVMGSFDSWNEGHFVAKRARFVDSHTLDLGDEKIQAEKIIIATGSRPVMTDMWRPWTKYLLDTDAFFEQERFPEKLAVVGLGVIGMELGQALHRLGFDVSGIGRSRSVGGLTDPFIKDYAIRKFSEEMNLCFGGVKEVRESGNQLVLSTESGDVMADKVLLAMGRRPNVDNIGLENLNVPLDAKGVPAYNKETFQMGDLPIFIAGDVTGENQILHEASDEGRIAGFNAVQTDPRDFKTRTPLLVTFSDPNIAIAGKSHQQLVSEGIDFEVGDVSFEGQGRSIVMMAERGHLRVYGDKASGRLLGAEMMAPDGEHLAHLVSWAVAMEMTVEETLNLPFYHPVVEEGLRTALRDLRDKLEVPLVSPLEVFPSDIGFSGRRSTN